MEQSVGGLLSLSHLLLDQPHVCVFFTHLQWCQNRERGKEKSAKEIFEMFKVYVVIL